MATPQKTGNEWVVNTTGLNVQEMSSVAMLDDGRLVVVWQDWSSSGPDTDPPAVRARILNQDGSQVGNDWVVSSITAGGQSQPVVEVLSDGRFVVAWTDASGMLGDNESTAVHFRLFQSDGTPVGTEQRANEIITWFQYQPAITALDDGGFVLGWTDHSGAFGDPGYAVVARVFNADGSARGMTFRMNATVDITQAFPDLANLSGGGFVATWLHEDAATQHLYILARSFDSNGFPQGSEIFVNTLNQSVTNPKVTGLPDNRFVVTWADSNPATSDGNASSIKAQVINSDGSHAGPEILVNDLTNGEQLEPDITALPDGRFVVTWTDHLGEGNGQGIFARVFSSTGIPEGGQFQVNTTTSNNQYDPSIAAWGNDGFVVTWTDASDPVNDLDIRVQSFSASRTLSGTEGADLIPGTVDADRIEGLGGNDTLQGLDGNDTLDGGSGNDRLIGGAGNDQMQGGTGKDTMLGGAGDDIYLVDSLGDRLYETTSATSTRDAGGFDSVFSAVSWTLGSYFEYLALMGSEDINGTGNAMDNTLVGSSGNNVLNGKGGNDSLLDLSGGDDTHQGGAGLDQIIDSGGSDVYLIGAGSHHAGAEITDIGSALDDELRFTSTTAGDTLTLFAGDTGIDRVRLVNAAGTTLGSVALNVDASAMSHKIGISGNNGANRITGTAFDDTLHGQAGNDTLVGGDGFDSIVGGSGNDRLDGGAGPDAMEGGAGSDTYVVDHIDDHIEETGTSATDIDTVETSISWSLGMDERLERLVLTGSDNISGFGNTQNNRLTGNSGDNLLLGMEGRDELIGGAGNDTMQGGDGVDTLRGGAGDDTYVLDTVGDQAIETRAADGQDQVLTTFDYTLGSHLEHLELLNVMGEMAVRGTGNELANRITGNSMDNILKGLAGNDTLFGGAGNDTLHGGTGLDALDGGDDNDVYLIARGSEHTAAEIADSGSLGNDVVRLTSAVSGDTLRLFAGDTGIEMVEVANADGNRNGTVALNIDASAVLGALTMLGNAGHNRLNGGAASDTMDGGDGSDRLDGGGGVDRMTGGRGNDTYVVDDVLDEVIESGTSLTEIDTVEAWVDWVLGANTERLVLKGTDDLNGAGNALANRLTGNSGNNELDGGAGKDTMLGGAGDDILYGGQGDDILVGGKGADWLNGDAGNDVFRFDSPLDASTNVDHIMNFEKGADQIELMASVFTRLSASGWNADKFRVFDTTPASIQGLDANDFILYDRSTGDLYYDRDGSGSAAAVKFAMLQSGTLLEWTDFLIT